MSFIKICKNNINQTYFSDNIKNRYFSDEIRQRYFSFIINKTYFSIFAILSHCGNQICDTDMAYDNHNSTAHINGTSNE